ncbi:MAG TPA: ABC transporter substrate-binding protein [Myxococcales bacterium]|nr:ABC transporter substrate-binding protein [Myxococcales bacterium]
MRTVLAPVALLLAACPRAPLPPDTVVLLVETPPETLDRRLALSAVAENVSGNLLEPGLLRVGEDGRPVPDLADRVEQIDPVTFHFELRPGLRFSDGSLLTADDVVATFRSLADPALASPLATKYSEIERVEARSDRDVEVTLRRPFAPFLVDMQLGIVPARRQAAPGQSAFGRHPIGAGPFRFVSWDDDEHLLLEANPTYYAGAPAIGHLLVETVRDETTRALELRSGAADIAINALSPPLLKELEAVPSLRILSQPGADAAYLMFQTSDPVLADSRVRRAIALAIDRAAIVRYKFLGHAHLADSLLPPSNWAHAPGLPAVHRDLAQAEALLDAAGHPQPAAGPRLRLDYAISTDRFRRSVAEAMAAQLAEAGIEVRLRPLEFGTFFSDVRKGSFELASLKWVPIVEPDLLYWVFASPSIPTPGNGYAGGNRERFRDVELDGWLAEARGTTDEAIRRADYARAQARLAQAMPYFPLWYEDSVAVVRRDLEGFVPSAFGYFTGLAQARRVRP